MRSSLLRLVAFAASIVLWAGTSAAQETTGKLEGRVLDSQGKPIPYVNVLVNGPALQGTRGVLSTRQGIFVLLALPVGDYSVRVSHVAYEGRTIDNVRVGLGQTATIGDLRLEERQLVTEKVIVLGRAPLIDPASTELGATLVVKDIEALPLERDYRNVALLLPSANASYLGDATNFAGSTGQENSFYVDGVDVSEPSRLMGGTGLPYNFIKEVEIRSGGYEAEYRSSLGGIINAVTNSGGNEVTGQAFGFYVNNRLAAEPRFPTTDLEKGDFAYYDIGFGVGGPLKRDKLWYYAAYNPTFERQDVGIPGCGLYEDASTSHRFAGKLTWRASENNTLVFTSVGDPTERRGVGAWYIVHSMSPLELFLNPDPYLNQIQSGGINFMLEGRHIVRDDMLLRTSLSLATHRDRVSPETERGATEILFIDAPTAVASGGTGERVDNASTVITAGAALTWLTGEHEIKGGLEYKSNRLDADWLWEDLTRYSDTYYFLFRWETEGTVSNRQLSTFVQDSWRLTERVRIKAGLRWDGQFWIGSDGKVAQTIPNQWQPRVGFVWQVGEPGTRQFTGSYGRFYQELGTFPMALFYNAGARTWFLPYDHDPRFETVNYDSLNPNGTIASEFALRGQHFDELTLGYQQRLGRGGKIALSGIYRTLRDGLEDGYGPNGGAFGNPGLDRLASFPLPKRNYSALELSYQQQAGQRLWAMGSYVLSRTYGNYPGLFNSDFGYAMPNMNGSFDFVETLTNGEGLLPNDRTHVFKLAGSFRFSTELTLAAVGLWQTGTPLNVFGGSTLGQPYYTFLIQRGTAGRTPSIWDLNLRLGYTPRFMGHAGRRTRLTLDLLHVASQRKPVDYDQIRYFNVDPEGNQIDPNPTYGVPTAYQPPMAIRLGAELSF